MSWNYRIIKRADYIPSDKEETEYEVEFSYSIYEVYYDDEDNIKFYSESPIHILGGNLEELRNDYLRQGGAFLRPVLDMIDLQEMFKEKR